MDISLQARVQLPPVPLKLATTSCQRICLSEELSFHHNPILYGKTKRTEAFHFKVMVCHLIG